MRFKIYFRAEGESTALSAFHRQLLPEFPGEIHTGKPSRVRTPGLHLNYWMTQPVPVAPSQFPADALLDLLRRHGPALGAASTAHGVAIHAQIVGYYTKDDTPFGFHYSRELGRCLAALDLDLDIDVYGTEEAPGAECVEPR